MSGNDLDLATHDESIAKEMYGVISTKFQLPGETDPPFTYLGLINDHNGADVNQRREHIKFIAANYIDLVVTSHGWNDTVKSLTLDKPLVPMPEDYISKVFVTTHKTIEGTAAHKDLKKKMGFSFCCLLGELMYAYVTYCPDIGYSICCLSKFITYPSELPLIF